MLCQCLLNVLSTFSVVTKCVRTCVCVCGGGGGQKSSH